ncbi:hypothetical protein ACFX11_023314 [Malus domestica]
MKIKGEHREENIEESKLPLQLEESKLPLQLEESRSATKGSKEVRRLRGQQLAKQSNGGVHAEGIKETSRKRIESGGSFEKKGRKE